MSANDYAILIGINDYPTLGEGGVHADLKGPCNDVDAIQAWLLDPHGGAIADPAHVKIIKSSAIAGESARPTADQLEAALAEIDAIGQRQHLQVGRRLYIFMSGHGFSPGRQRACLFAADARERLSYNIHATGWLNWLTDSGYFREYVLWMDCCMNRMSFLQARDPPLPLVNSSESPAAGFVAFAAQRPLKAVEVDIAEDGGKTHGAFTWALLEGLRGAAADHNGRVTGRSLGDWLRNAQVARISPEDREDLDVSKEPEIVQEDAGLIFSRGISKPSYPVSLTFPQAAKNETALLWSGQPPRVVENIPLGTAPLETSLRPGLYLVEVPAAGLRQGFEVVCATSVQIIENGPRVNPASDDSLFELDIDSGDPTAEIFVIDSTFSMADNNSARLTTRLPFGIFKIKTRIGRSVMQRVVLLDRDRPPFDANTVAPVPSAVAPLDGTSTSHEYHIDGANAARDQLAQLSSGGQGAGIMLMARTWSAPGTVPGAATPWSGVLILDDRGTTVIDLERDGTRHASGDPYAYYAASVAPGTYYLRQRLADGATIEQSLVATKGWALDVFVLSPVSASTTAVFTRPRVSISLRELGQTASAADEDRIIEIARTALADERRILNAELEEFLFRKSRNPMAAIIGGHLLLVERERDPGRDLATLPEVVAKLQKTLGTAHPDVVALALASPGRRPRLPERLESPPMLQRSWKILVDASQKRGKLIPAEMWERVQATSALPPFMVWATGAELRQSARAELSRAIFRDKPAGLNEASPTIFAQAMLQPGVAGGATVKKPARYNAWSMLVRSRAASLQVPYSAIASLIAQPEDTPLAGSSDGHEGVVAR
jgi:hypothetical protein